MNTTHSQRFPGLEPVTEAFRKTTPGFIGLNLLLFAATYALTYGINALLAPINSPITSWLGLLLMLIVAAVAFTLIGTNALDRAEELDNSPLDALHNIPAALPVTTYLVISTVLIGSLVIFLFGSQALVPLTLLVLWPTPLVISSLIDRSDEPIAAFKDAITTSITDYTTNLPTFITIIVITTLAALLLISAPILLPLYLIYFLPFTTMLIATLYKATAP